MIQNLPRIDQIILPHPLPRLLLILGDAAPDVPLHQPPRRGIHVDLDKPQLVHEPRGLAPRLAVQAQVVALAQHDAHRGPDGDGVCDGIFDGVVERGRMQRARLWRERLPEGAD